MRHLHAIMYMYAPERELNLHKNGLHIFPHARTGILQEQPELHELIHLPILHRSFAVAVSVLGLRHQKY